MAFPINIKNLLNGDTIEWDRIELKKARDPTDVVRDKGIAGIDRDIVRDRVHDIDKVIVVLDYCKKAKTRKEFLTNNKLIRFMETIENIIRLLKEKRQQFKSISNFSDKPGIYAVFFHGDNFPLDKTISQDEIIYIGKTESSQKSRDADTHFKSGKTGSSTLRKSFGALLRDELELIPFPRNKVDYKKGKFSHFAFDPESEEKLTSWMIDNLGLSFYEYDKTKEEIKSLESELISLQIPVLNLQKNAKNPFISLIKKLRKDCAEYAREHSQITSHVDQPIVIKNNKETIEDNSEPPSYDFLKLAVVSDDNKNSKDKYIELWKSNRERIISTIEKTKWGPRQVQMNKAEFERVGGRDSYTFNLELNKMEVANNIGGSAVARDLNKVLRVSAQAVKLLANGYFNFNMNKAFVLRISRK